MPDDDEMYRRSVEAASTGAARPKPRSAFSDSLIGYIVIWAGVLTAAWLIYATVIFLVTRLVR